MLAREAAAKERINPLAPKKPHFEGKAAVVLHCAMHTFRDSPNANEYREFLGVTTHEHETATMLEIKPVLAQAKNPILAGFPDVWKTPVNDEAYIILKQWPNTVPLATVYGKMNNVDFTCAWTSIYGKGRVFGTTLGHATEVVKDDTYIQLVGRGLLWSVDKLGADGKKYLICERITNTKNPVYRSRKACQNNKHYKSTNIDSHSHRPVSNQMISFSLNNSLTNCLSYILFVSLSNQLNYLWW